VEGRWTAKQDGDKAKLQLLLFAETLPPSRPQGSMTVIFLDIWDTA